MTKSSVPHLRVWHALAGLAVLVVIIDSPVLFAGSSQVLGAADGDMFLQFLAWRQFGFSELKEGNLALWNPHVYCGVPFFGGFQSALLYPLNFLFLLFPVVPAVNVTIALHTWLFGAASFAWMRIRGLDIAAAFLAGTLAMFGGTYVPHVSAGHLPNLCTMPWAPVILLTLDGARADPTWRQYSRWLLIGSGAVAMMVLAGHPQYVFYTAVAAGLYACLLWGAKAVTWRIPALWAGMYFLGGLLSAVQLFPGIASTEETIRGLPIPFEFAAMFGFPPENLLTLVAPAFFGDMVHRPYWGRCYLWEMSLFMSITGVVLAGVALRHGVQKPGRWIPVAMVLGLFVLALGAHTPLFHFLYSYVPGFNKFRGMSKFTFPALLFGVALAADGFQCIQKMVPGGLVKTIFLAAALILASGASVAAMDWRSIIRIFQGLEDFYLVADYTKTPEFVQGAHSGAVWALLSAGIVCCACATLLLLMRKHPQLSYAILALAVLEVSVFAWRMRAEFDPTYLTQPGVAAFLKERTGDHRILNPTLPNNTFTAGGMDISGADPGVTRRYAEFITWSQGGDPNQATQDLRFTKLDPLYTMLRLRFAVMMSAGKTQVVEASEPMRRLELIDRYRVLPDRDAIFKAMRTEGFDPRKEVLLESEPDPRPEPGNGSPGTVRLVSSATDSLVVDADLSRAAILLITDAWSANWRAAGLRSGLAKQIRYDVLPANYVLRAVPLAAGRHRVRIAYSLRSFEAGLVVSIFSWLAWISTAVVVFPELRSWAGLPRASVRP